LGHSLRCFPGRPSSAPRSVATQSLAQLDESWLFEHGVFRDVHPHVHEIEETFIDLVILDLLDRRAVAEEIEKAGGTSAMCRVGHSFVKAQMRESGAIFAGELSGHMYFRFSDTLVADDGTAAFVVLLAVLAAEKKPLSAIVDPLRRYYASGEINRKVSDKQALMDAIQAEHADAMEVSNLDGLLVRYPDWWFNLRPSNTEPVLRLNLEARTEAEMIEKRDALLARIGGAPA